jgi:hypothetical protein
MGDKSKCIFLCDALLYLVLFFCFVIEDQTVDDCGLYVVVFMLSVRRLHRYGFWKMSIDSFYSFLFLLHFLVGILRTFVLDLRCTKKSYRVIFSCGGR